MGGKSKKTTVGYWYRIAYHHGIGIGPIDAFLEFRGGDKTAWKGALTASGTITVNAPNLWGGEKDQGGIVGALDVMFGEAGQQPNAYLASAFGGQQSAWRGLSTVAFKGGRFGAMNPYPQKPSYKVRRIIQAMRADGQAEGWYEAKAAIPMGVSIDRRPIPGSWPWVDRDANWFVVGAAQETSGTYSSFQGWWHGYIDCFRVTKSFARYAATQYDVPTAPFGDAETDPYYSSVVLLLRMLGENGSTDFQDDKGHTVQAFGGASISTAQSKFGGSSAYFDGVDDWLKVTMGGDADLGDGPWTMDAWVWLESHRSSAYSRALFGYGPTNQGADDTAWYAAGNAWHFDQLEVGNLHQPSIVQNVEPYAETGRWAFVSICFDGDNYWLHQDGKLLTAASISDVLGMNPAHILYYSRTQSDMGREPTASINSVSFTAAADWFYEHGFGICPSYDPSAESVDEFEQRICRVAGCSLTRSLIDGQWYLDIANGEYDLNSLPILTDDDILEFQEQPTLLDSAVNSVSVKYFDPAKKETITTSPVQAPALIADFGTNHLTLDYPEIPDGALAARVAQRELLARITPLRAFPLKTTRKPYAWRPSTYFRLQSPKRRIADMVCILGEKSSGQLRSGAMTINATQDVYSLPAVSFVEIEHGVDTTPPQAPLPVIQQRAFEAPYIEVVTALSRADLEVLPSETGFLLTVAVGPTGGIDYTVMVSSGSDYVESANGDWCASALVVESSGFGDTAFTLADGYRLGAVEVGQPALWGTEIVRVDSLDVGTGAVSLGRGCGDTVPVEHAAGQRIWFFGTATAADPTEYTDGETVDVKLLTNTGSQQLAIAAAPPMSASFDSRAARPYPPGQLRVNGQVAPASVIGEITVSWVHRDRVQQADQLVDHEMAGVGPEAGTTYTVRYILNGVLVHTDASLAAAPSTYTPAGGGVMRVEVESERDGLVSWQKHMREFSLGNPLLDQTGGTINDQADQPFLME